MINKKKLNKRKLQPRKKKKLPPTVKENWFISKGASTARMSPMERMVAKHLRALKVYYHREVSFKDLNPTGKDWGYLRFDFYIPSKRAVIEYDGKAWHETPEQKMRDQLKNDYCLKHGIKILRLVAKDIPQMEKKLKIYLEISE